MVTLPDSLLTWGTGGLSVGLGLYIARLIGRGVAWLFVFFTDRHDKREGTIDEGMKSLIEGLRSEVERLTTECRELRDWRKRAEAELDECRRRHAAAEAEVKGLKAMFQDYGDARQIAALQTAADKADKKAEE